MMALPDGSCPVTIRRKDFCISDTSASSGREGFRDPIRNVSTAIGHVVDADMLDAARPVIEELELALRAIDELIVCLMGVLHGNLTVLAAVRDEKRHSNAVQHSVQVHLGGNRHEGVHVLGTPHPLNMFPVMRHRPIAFAHLPAPLYFAPIVIRAPA